MSLFFTVAWNDNNNQMRERATRLSTLGVPAKKRLFIILSQSGYKWLWLRQMLKALMNRIDVVSPTKHHCSDLCFCLHLHEDVLSRWVSHRWRSTGQKVDYKHTEAAHQSWKMTLKTPRRIPRNAHHLSLLLFLFSSCISLQNKFKKIFGPNEMTFMIFSIVALFSWQLSN